MAVLSDAARRALYEYDAVVSQAGLFQVQLAKVLPSMSKLLADIGGLRKGVSNFTDRMKQVASSLLLLPFSIQVKAKSHHKLTLHSSDGHVGPQALHGRDAGNAQGD